MQEVLNRITMLVVMLVRQGSRVRAWFGTNRNQAKQQPVPEDGGEYEPVSEIVSAPTLTEVKHFSEEPKSRLRRQVKARKENKERKRAARARANGAAGTDAIDDVDTEEWAKDSSGLITKPKSLDEWYSDDLGMLPREAVGQFVFRDMILDQLDRYEVYMDRMKRWKYEHGLYSRIGAHIIPWTAHRIMGGDRPRDNEERDLSHLSELSPWWKKNRPAFGAIAFGVDPRVEQEEMERTKQLRAKNGKRWSAWIPKFLMFRKYSHDGVPLTVQPVNSGDDVYIMTIYWDRPQDKDYKRKFGTPQEYAVVISEDGADVRVLKCLQKIPVSIKSRFSSRDCRNGVKTSIDFSRMEWRIGADLEGWAKDNGDTAERYLRNMFIDVVNEYEWLNEGSMIQIRASRRDTTAVFSVAQKSVPEFFSDRDLVVDCGGRKARIFHLVRPHKRTTKKGDLFVRMHFRGMRSFKWNGWEILITVPGLHHDPIAHFTPGMCDEATMIEPKRERIDSTDIAKFLSSHVRGKPRRDAYLEHIKGRNRDHDPEETNDLANLKLKDRRYDKYAN